MESIQKKQIADFFPLLGLTLLALGLRLFRIESRSVWLDEAYSLRLASAPWRDIIQGASMDIHPPLFHLLLGGWIRMWGTSEFALRSLSALAGCLLVPTAFGLARAWGGKNAAWWCAGLVACSPYFVELSRSGRMGSLLALGAVLSVWFFWRLLQSDTLGNRAGFLAATAAALYTHYFGFLAFASGHFYRFVNLRRLVFTRLERRNWMLLQLLLLLAYMPWLTVLVEHLTLGGPSWRGQGTTWWEPVHSIYAFLFGTALWTPAGKLWAVGLLAAAAIVAAGGLLAGRTTPPEEGLKHNGMGMALTLIVIPLGLVWAYSQNRLNVFDNRYLSASACAVLFLIAAALARLPKWPQIVAGALVLASFCVPLYHQYFVNAYYDDWRQVAAAIKSRSQPGDLIAVYPAWNENPLAYYVRNHVPIQGLPGTYDPISGVTRGYYAIDRDTVGRVEHLLPPGKRVWLVLVNENESQAALSGWFREHYHQVQEQQMGSIHVSLFRPQPRGDRPVSREKRE